MYYILKEMNVTNAHQNIMFSVVIPVHNKLPHLERSINSVLNQTYKDFELILIDDASTDGSSKKLKKFQGENIRVFTRDTPGPGGYAARNLGIEEAKGTWVAFLDADDEWFPNHLEKMSQLAIAFPNVYLMSSGYQRLNGNQKNENAFYKKHKGQGNFRLNLTEYLNYSLLKLNPVWTSVAFVRKDSPKVKELFPAKLDAKRGGDLHAWLKLMCEHKAMAWSDHLGAIYHLDSTNMVTKSAKASPQLMSKTVYEELSKNLSVLEKKLLRKSMNSSLKTAYLSSFRRGAELFNLTPMIYWKGDFIAALELLFMSLTPRKGLVFLQKIKIFL